MDNAIRLDKEKHYMKKGLTMGALAAAVLLAAGCSSSGGAPENQQQGMSQSGTQQSGSMSGASETPTGTSHGSPMGTSPGGGIDSNNDTMPSNTQSGT